MILSLSLSAGEIDRMEAMVDDIEKLRSDYSECKKELDKQVLNNILPFGELENSLKRDIVEKNKTIQDYKKRLDKEIVKNTILISKVDLLKKENKQNKSDKLVDNLKKVLKTKAKDVFNLKNEIIRLNKIIENNNNNLILVKKDDVKCVEDNQFPKLIMKDSIKVLSVNISKEKGTIKLPEDKIQLTELGVKNDAHAGNWHRQVSMLAKESIDKFPVQAKRDNHFGQFAEDITAEDLLPNLSAPLDRVHISVTVLSVTPIVKKCHGDNCSIFREIGNCVMPKEGIFCRVLNGGNLKAGDVLCYHPRVIKTMVITLSDRASRGEYADKSGPLLEKLAEEFFKSKNRHYQIEKFINPDQEFDLTNLL